MSEREHYPCISDVLIPNYKHVCPDIFENVIDDQKLELLTQRKFKELTDGIKGCKILVSKLQNRRLKVNRDKARRKHEEKSRMITYILTLEKRNLLLGKRELLREITLYQNSINMYYQDYCPNNE